jgi:hypothetical protein
MSVDCFLIIASIDGVINTKLVITSLEDILLEVVSLIWQVSSFTIPSDNSLVLDTETDLLGIGSLPYNLSELVSRLLFSIISSSSTEVIVFLTGIPLVTCFIFSKGFEIISTSEDILSTFLVDLWSFSLLLHIFVSIQK